MAPLGHGPRTLYNNILEDRETIKETVKQIASVIGENPDSMSYLKLKEIETLQDSNNQLIKISELMKNLLVAKSAPKQPSIAGLLLGEEERNLLTSGEDETSMENIREIENYDEVSLEDEESETFEEEIPEDEIVEGETEDLEESDYDALIESIEKE